MGLNLKIEEAAGNLSLIYEGHLDSADIPIVIDQVIQACEKYKPSKILTDFLSVTGTLSTMDRFNLSTLFAMKYLKGRMTGRIPKSRLAFLGKYPLVDPKRFGETVAINRGINVKVFTDKAEALAWLSEEPSEEPGSPG